MHYTPRSATVRLAAGKAFTLIELLVVISIITLLISILLPVLSKARSSAQDVICKNKLRQLGVAMFMYLGDNKDIYPSYPETTDVRIAWDWKIKDYLNYNTTGSTDTWGPALFHCPNGSVHSTNFIGASRGYAMNQWVARPQGLPGGDANLVLNNGFGRSPGDEKQVLLAEVWRSSYGMTGSGGVGFPEVFVGAQRANTQYIWSSSANAVDMAYRHNQSGNFLIKDGHVTGRQRGNTGFGEDMYWFFRADGAYFKDGYVIP